MIVQAQAPCRISLMGGGTDLPIFSQEYGGMCISMAINIRQHIQLGNNYHLSEYDNYDFFHAFTDFNVDHNFDGISESGLGSSASLAVALVAADAKAKGIYLNRREIALKAWEIEVNKLGLYGGMQDQMAATYGGMNVFYFGKAGPQINYIEREKAEFCKRHILLFYTGDNRKNTKIQEQFKSLTPEKVQALQNIKLIAHDAKKYLFYGEFKLLGELFNEAWKEKKKSNPLVTTDRINKIYDLALSYGAEGGKLMGSGGGGFMFFWAKPSCQGDIIRELEEFGCKNWDYSIDWQGVDTRII